MNVVLCSKNVGPGGALSICVYIHIYIYIYDMYKSILYMYVYIYIFETYGKIYGYIMYHVTIARTRYVDHGMIHIYRVHKCYGLIIVKHRCLGHWWRSLDWDKAWTDRANICHGWGTSQHVCKSYPECWAIKELDWNLVFLSDRVAKTSFTKRSGTWQFDILERVYVE